LLPGAAKALAVDVLKHSCMRELELFSVLAPK